MTSRAPKTASKCSEKAWLSGTASLRERRSVRRTQDALTEWRRGSNRKQNRAQVSASSPSMHNSTMVWMAAKTASSTSGAAFLSKPKSASSFFLSDSASAEARFAHDFAQVVRPF
ncbi:hypothetical protein TGPRC2_244408 [Toxoplasma gondii TgCatPRC2]|uniref:Uncharacterized protein n=4 Tax=Toxoplasma gondii TaxID=5811 RepID=A0A151HRV5_TOXGO|nr:hypothetical protein TGME49_244408 [Toxoplasma gondii ME49]EPT30564.1 hypothetical protein TGME49_244408 [Toxoplasma gondii ME49]KYF40942.1 hypothetical protein TGARI_244408 [Toxoplasma gondii ARI]KYK72010.1 hypothetical protein TGPRC2_244408 [Toxoplasma gondii TgCatPRC2]PIM02836.1 hypothetical protein TGCOUG_244408 [Toxoplasma gondii COUG]|eukprot:XP_018637552.1 hypothetical protein TGME49_244408 [Toxoplasma gondii ME49]